jgi:pimeloyl-ACP methyl ester carboxylesterase
MTAPATVRPSKVPPGFERRRMTVNGAEVVMYVGGSGDPLVFLHGAGTASGFNFSAPWARTFTVHLPYHPGFGESPDCAAIGSIDDYVLHYLELFDALKLDTVHLAGLSTGGWIAATLAAQNSHRLRKLVLVGPAGLRVPEHPTTDIFRLKPEEVPAHLAEDLSVLAPHVPDPHSPEFLDFIVNDYHEMSSFARLAWERPYDPHLAKWLHRISVPTLLLYGSNDRITPAPQSKTWAALIPDSTVRIVEGAGHLVLDEKEEARQAVLEFLSKS